MSINMIAPSWVDHSDPPEPSEYGSEYGSDYVVGSKSILSHPIVSGFRTAIRTAFNTTIDLVLYSEPDKAAAPEFGLGARERIRPEHCCVTATAYSFPFSLDYGSAFSAKFGDDPGDRQTNMHITSTRFRAKENFSWLGDPTSCTKRSPIQDFQDLFCTLMVALPLGPHRHRLTRHMQTFTTGEALNHLGNLRFTQSNRRPSPNDPNVMVTTKIATTFSMVAPMARSLCNKFLAARLVESVEGKSEFSTQDSIWQLTAKGIKLLENFAHRNGVQERHVFDVLDSNRNKMNLLVLEREPETDQLYHDQETVHVIFRRFLGNTPNLPSKDSTTSDTEAIFESDGNTGVRVHRDRKIANKYHQYTFSNRAAIDWLMNCCTLVDIREAQEIVDLFQKQEFVRVVHEDRSSPNRAKQANNRGNIYKITESGQGSVGWIPNRKASPAVGDRERSPAGMRDSNTNRMNFIVNTTAMRIMFREFLKDTHCEENLIFYLEVRDFLGRWTHALRRQKASMDQPPLDTVRETLAAAYDLYNAFLAPGSPCELNIDHTLRNALVSRMTRFELPDVELLHTVKEVIQLYDQAQNSVFKLMASDSVPKFLKDPSYSKAILEYNAKTDGVLDAHQITVPPTTRMAALSTT